MRRICSRITAMLVCSAMMVAGATTAANAAAGVQIQVDQVGYLPQYPKVAMVTAATGSSGFKVINTDTNAVVFQGTLSAPQKDACSGDTVRKADFSAVTAPGTYAVVVDGAGTSAKFKIEDNVYYIPLVYTLRSYTLGRSNVAVNDPITGLSHAVAHEKYKEAKLFFSDDVSAKGDVIDVSGGWYDAGDYGKYTPTTGITAANILLAVESQPEKFKQGQMFFPPGLDDKTTMPDVLAEMKVGLDWMLKMQRSDGAFYLKTSGRYWPDLTCRPEDDTQARYVFGLSTYGTALCGAANALAARVYEKYDPQYAAKLVESAKKAYAYLESHPTASFRRDENQNTGSGPYDKVTENEQNRWLAFLKKTYPGLNKSEDAEERIWLAAELFKTTGEKQYEQYIQDKYTNVITVEPLAFSWMNTLALGQWAYITNPNADQTLKAKVRQTFLSYADKTVKDIAADGYGCSLTMDEFTWSSNRVAAAKANMLALAYQLQPKQEYVFGALDQIHYIFGRNTNGKSYLTGAGVNPPLHPHNRMHETLGAYVPGMLVGGPNNWPGGDGMQVKTVTENPKIPPSKVYFDMLDSYSTNEYAIDYTAPLTYILAYFSQPSDGLTADDIKLKQ